MGYGPVSPGGKQLPITPWKGSWAEREQARRLSPNQTKPTVAYWTLTQETSVMDTPAYKDISPHIGTDNGYLWNLYSIEFTSPEGSFRTILSAVSHEHAELQLDALKSTGYVNGQVIGRSS